MFACVRLVALFRGLEYADCGLTAGRGGLLLCPSRMENENAKLKDILSLLFSYSYYYASRI